MTQPLSTHARKRCQQRGISHADLTLFLEQADIETPANDNCVCLRVSKNAAKAAKCERLCRIALIYSHNTGKIVTVTHITKNSSYLRRH